MMGQGGHFLDLLSQKMLTHKFGEKFHGLKGSPRFVNYILVPMHRSTFLGSQLSYVKEAQRNCEQSCELSMHTQGRYLAAFSSAFSTL